MALSSWKMRTVSIRNEVWSFTVVGMCGTEAGSRGEMYVVRGIGEGVNRSGERVEWVCCGLCSISCVYPSAREAALVRCSAVVDVVESSVVPMRMPSCCNECQ